MLIFGQARDCGKCGKSYHRFTEQEMPRYCSKCNKEVYYCDHCVPAGCPRCGGKLVDIWTLSGGKILF